MYFYEKSNKMSQASETELVKNGDQIIIKKANVLKSFEVRKHRTISMERSKVPLGELIGLPWGCVFEMNKGKIEKLNATDTADDDDVELNEAKDNRSLMDARTNQKLTREEIHSMKQEGATGQDIVENLIENSATFDKKTEFAQQKYIRKKRKKHEARFTILKPNTRLIAQLYFNRGPSKICNLRMDSIAQILAHGNVHAGCRLMLVENCNGLLLGAVMERMAGIGQLVQLFSGTAPIRQALEIYNFPKEFYSTLHAYPLNQVALLKKDPDNTDSKLTSIVTCKDETGISEDNEDMTPERSHVDASENGASVCDSMGESSNIQHSAEGSSEAATVETVEQVEKPSTSDHQNNPKNIGKRRWEDLDEEEKETRKRVKQEALQKVRDIIQKKDMDGLIIASKYLPRSIVLELIEYVLPSRPIIVFCQYKEPLLDCYMALRDRGGVLSLRLTETWLRGYQVLPNRSHPEINMSGTGGYLLTGIKVASYS